MEWFYEKNGAQAGPVSVDALKGLIASGEIEIQNLIWRQGMADWAPYSSVFEAPGEAIDCPTCGAKVLPEQLIPAGDRQVCPNCRDNYAQGLKEGVTTTAGLSGGRGTGGMTPNSELRAMARASLSGNWGTAVASLLILGVLWFVTVLLSFVPVVGTLVQWLLYGPFMLGFIGLFVAISRQEQAEVGLIFSGFSKFWKACGIYFMVSLITGLVALAAAIPGIIMVIIAFSGNTATPEENPLFLMGLVAAAVPAVIVSLYFYLRYSMVYFIVNDHEEVGVFESLKMSTQMMSGNKMKLFGLGLSFIGWHFLGMLALYIGLLWSYSYMMTAVAAFYDDIGEEV